MNGDGSNQKEEKKVIWIFNDNTNDLANVLTLKQVFPPSILNSFYDTH